MEEIDRKRESVRIKVKAFAAFREILGRETNLELEDGMTIGDLLRTLYEMNPRFGIEAFDSSGMMKDYVLIMKNLKRLDSSADLGAKLEEGDEVAIFPPASGG